MQNKQEKMQWLQRDTMTTNSKNYKNIQNHKETQNSHKDTKWPEKDAPKKSNNDKVTQDECSN